MKKLLSLLCALISCYAASAINIEVTALRTEQMTNPMGLDTPTPRFSWRLETDGKNIKQVAYHILVADSPELLEKGIGNLWDSGKTASDASLWIPYSGKRLSSNMRCYWKVRCYTNKGTTPWSTTASWSIGILDCNEWKGCWIGYDTLAPLDSFGERTKLSARYLRKEFHVNKTIKQATAHIAGLGMYELYINAHRIGDQVLAPAATDYRKTVIYNTFDVTPLLQNGGNAIGVILGNGRYFPMRNKALFYFGYPRLLMNIYITYTDDSLEVISTDPSWKLSYDGAIQSNNEYDGETYDARKEFNNWTSFNYDDHLWLQAQQVKAPGGTLRGAMAPNMKVTRKLTPLSITPIGNRYIIDMGQNMAGWIRFSPRGASGDTIRLHFAESLKQNGELYTENLRSAQCTDYYICNGKENSSWAPHFVYHGFRYVEISGMKNAKLSDFIGEVICDEMQTLGSFSCSDSTLNRIYRNACWGILDNYKGFPIDCPQRDERQPWLGDHAIGSWGESYAFENGPLYAKWMRDICEAQRADGCIPDVAPIYWKIFTDNVTWPSTLPIACDMLYTQYGNIQPMQSCYNNIKHWLQHIKEAYMTDYIICKDKYGDWCVPPEGLKLIHSQDPTRISDGNLLSTAYYIHLIQIMEGYAERLSMPEDKKYWEDLRSKMTIAFNKRFLNREKGYYDNNTVTANILPLAFDIIPQEYTETVIENLKRTIQETNKGHISCGVIGIQWIMRELSRRGFSDIAFQLATNTTYPSWGYMVENGATTIWELWNGNTASPKMNSGNHVMLLGDLIPWCYENLGGIRSDSEKIAFKKIIMKPDFNITQLSYVNASYLSPYGKISSNWQKEGNSIIWNITIPANTSAEIHFPDGNIKNIRSGSYSYKFNSIKPLN